MAQPKLNQLLAVERQTKTSTHEQVTAQYQIVQKEPLLSGISRTYRALDEDGEKFPAESTSVQVRVSQVLKTVSERMTDLFDITLARDTANCTARADLEVDGKTLLKDVPVTYLLWLEKQLTDIHSVIVKLPTLPQTEDWTYDASQDVFKSATVETAKTKKLPRAFVKAEATKEHPAQVEVVHDDRVTGYWSTTKFSGAIQKQRAQLLRDRAEKLLAATKFAREKANLVETQKVSAAAEIFGYLFAG